MQNSLRKQLIRIAREFKVNVRFKHLRADIDGCAYDGKIFVDRDLGDSSRTVSAFFHELGHVICAREGKFPAFHVGTTKINSHTSLNKILRLRRAVLSTAWRAEKYVDFLGEVLMGQYFPHLEYEAGYSTKAEREWLKGYWSGYFDGLIKWRKTFNKK